MVYRGKKGKRPYKEKSNGSSGAITAGSVRPASYINPARPYLQVDKSKSSIGTPTGSIARMVLVQTPACDGSDNATVTSAMSDAYSRIRAVNAGAVNYGPNYLYSYMYWVRYLYGAFMEAVKYDAAVDIKLMGYADYPYAMFNAVGGFNYDAYCATRADSRAELVRIAQDLDALPKIPFELYQKDYEVQMTIIKESHGGRVSYLAPVLGMGFVPTWDGEAWGIYNPNLPTDATRFTTIVNSIKQWLRDLTANPVFAILRGDILKAYGPVRSGPTAIEILQKGLNITDEHRYVSMFHNANVLQIMGNAFTISNSSATTNPEFMPRAQITLVIPGINDGYELSIYDMPAWNEEELEYATRLKPIVQHVSGNTYTLITRGYLALRVTWLTGLSATSPTILESRSLISDGQTSTMQSAAVSAVNRLAMLTVLSPSMLPAYIANDEETYITWATDGVWELPDSAAEIMYRQMIRNAYLSAPLVWSKNAQKMA